MLHFIRLLFAMSRTIFRFIFACPESQAGLGNPALRRDSGQTPSRYTEVAFLWRSPLAEVGILIIDDDVVSQRALKNVLDSEGWRIRLAPLASQAMSELATGQWNLVIVNIALTDVRGPLFSILKELAQTESHPAPQAENEALPKRIRVLFLVPLLAAKHAQPILEQEGLPYSLKPYHLHEFLEKVSELLVESGALAVPIRSMGDFSALKKRERKSRSSRDSRRGTMFASREDYQMSEEELIEFEKQEEEDRKKREKELHDRQHLG